MLKGLTNPMNNPTGYVQEQNVIGVYLFLAKMHFLDDGALQPRKLFLFFFNCIYFSAELF